MKKISVVSIVVFLFTLLSVSISSIAEEITLTTYYPAPYGAYEELSTTGNTYLATDDSAKVGIGTTEEPSQKLLVAGDALVQGDGGFDGGGDSATIYLGDSGHYWSTTWGARDIIKSYWGYDFESGTGTLMTILQDGKVGIGTDSPNFKLDVAGDINTTGDVRRSGAAYTHPDYVFEAGYELMPLAELRDYVGEYKHLPNMSSKEEIRLEGVRIFEQNRLILEKLEEAYLYIFELEERLSKLERQQDRI